MAKTAKTRARSPEEYFDDPETLKDLEKVVALAWELDPDGPTFVTTRGDFEWDVWYAADNRPTWVASSSIQDGHISFGEGDSPVQALLDAAKATIRMLACPGITPAALRTIRKTLKTRKTR